MDSNNPFVFVGPPDTRQLRFLMTSFAGATMDQLVASAISRRIMNLMASVIDSTVIEQVENCLSNFEDI